MEEEHGPVPDRHFVRVPEQDGRPGYVAFAGGRRPGGDLAPGVKPGWHSAGRAHLRQPRPGTFVCAVTMAKRNLTYRMRKPFPSRMKRPGLSFADTNRIQQLGKENPALHAEVEAFAQHVLAQKPRLRDRRPRSVGEFLREKYPQVFFYPEH